MANWFPIEAKNFMVEKIWFLDEKYYVKVGKKLRKNSFRLWITEILKIHTPSESDVNSNGIKMLKVKSIA